MSDKVACWSWCQSVTDCNWFSYDKTKSQTCILFGNCPEIEENLQFISGQKDCHYTYCMLLLIYIFFQNKVFIQFNMNI